MAHRGGHRVHAGQFGADGHAVARRQRAVLSRGHHQFHAQRVDHGHPHQRALLDPFARVGEALHHHTGERAAQGAQRQLRLGHAVFLDPYALLALDLVEFLFCHFGFAARLFSRLVGHEVLRHQRLCAAHLLFGQVQARLRSEHVGVDQGTGACGRSVRALHLGAQGQQRLPGHDRVAAFDIEALDQAHDL